MTERCATCRNHGFVISNRMIEKCPDCASDVPALAAAEYRVVLNDLILALDGDYKASLATAPRFDAVAALMFIKRAATNVFSVEGAWLLTGDGITLMSWTDDGEEFTSFTESEFLSSQYKTTFFQSLRPSCGATESQ